MAITVADIFPFSMVNNELGFTVERNASSLSAILAQGAGSLSLVNGTAEDIFGTSKQLIIGQEIVLLTSGNTITRAQEGTDDVAHPAEANVRLRGGTSIVTFTFTGVESLTAFGMKGSAPAMYQVKINGDYGLPFFTGALGQEQFFPFSGITPTVNDEIELVVWTSVAVAEFWGSCNL